MRAASWCCRAASTRTCTCQTRRAQRRRTGVGRRLHLGLGRGAGRRHHDRRQHDVRRERRIAARGARPATPKLAERRRSRTYFCTRCSAAPTPQPGRDPATARDDGCSSIKVFLISPTFDRDVGGYVEAIRRRRAERPDQHAALRGRTAHRHATGDSSSAGETSLCATSAPAGPWWRRWWRRSGPWPSPSDRRARLHRAPVQSSGRSTVCAEARARGVPVYVETRPLYLHLTSELLDGPEPGRFVGQPPLREAVDVQALWAGLASGEVDTVCTDHAPWSLAAKLDRGPHHRAPASWRREPATAAADAVLRGRSQWPHLAPTTGRADQLERRAAVRPLPAQGRAGRRQRRGPGAFSTRSASAR